MAHSSTSHQSVTYFNVMYIVYTLGYVMEVAVGTDVRKCDGGTGSAVAAGAGNDSGGFCGITAFTMGTKSFSSPCFKNSGFQGSSKNDGSKNARGLDDSARLCGVPRA